MLETTHQKCFAKLERMMQTLEGNGHTRLVMYEPGQTMLLDGNPAPGYTPGVKGKRETGVAYVPQSNGSPINFYYLAGKDATEKQVRRASRHTKSGGDPNNLEGRIIDMRRTSKGNIQVQFVVLGRDERDENGNITEEIAIDSVSISSDPAQGGGILVAMSVGQTLGIPFDILKQMAEDEKSKYWRDEVRGESTVVGDSVRQVRDRVLGGIPRPGDEQPSTDVNVDRPSETTK